MRVEFIVCGVMPGLEVLTSIRKTKQTMMSKPMSSIRLWPSHQLLPSGSCPI